MEKPIILRRSRCRIGHGALLAGIAIILLASAPLAAESIAITQIDASRLMSSQSVRLFLGIDLPPSEGSVDPGKIKVSESADGKDFSPVRVRSVSRTANMDEGISFFLLLDNSGSMWDGLDGKPADSQSQTRSANAKEAVRKFCAELSPLDRAGLAIFNTDLKTISAVSADTSGIESILDVITKPSRDEAYTELYGSVESTIKGFGETGRRKALIILSDGEHFPFPTKQSDATAESAIDSGVREGVTCYAVNFGSSSDDGLKRIANETGGLVFNARNSDELLGIYTSIRASILDEYALTYTASMAAGDKRYVRVSYAGEGGTYKAERYYYSGNLLGSNAAKPSAFHLLFVLIPLAVWLSLLFFRLERETTGAGIQLLYGAKGMQTKAFMLTSQQTVIGGDATADITIAGNPAMRGNAATILFDETKGQYTIAAASDLTVNNKSVKTKKLESGDVINMAGTVVVFDENEKKPKRKKSDRRI